MDWNPYAPPQANHPSQTRARLVLHCIGLIVFSLSVWWGLTCVNPEGRGLGAFFFGAVAGLILWLWSNDEKHSVRYMFVGSLGIGLIGFATLASAQALKEIGGEIQANPLTLLMFLFPVSIFAGFNTAVLIISLWVWNILARIVRWIVESI